MCDCGALDSDRSCRWRRWPSGGSGRWRRFIKTRSWFWNQRHVEYVALLELGFSRFEFGCWLCGFIPSFGFFLGWIYFNWWFHVGNFIGGFGVGLVADLFDCLAEFCFVGNGWVIVLEIWSNNFGNASAIGTVIYVVLMCFLDHTSFKRELSDARACGWDGLWYSDQYGEKTG